MSTNAIARLTTALADRYRIERELGAGGMATVYLAQDLKHDRKVAIKVLRPELAAVIGAERFLREIKTIANLQHPHILGLIDSGEVDGTAYYVMPFVEGESLRDRLNREKQLPIPDAVRLSTEMAAALDYAHRHGVIHRDIKPENILLHDGSALVADFGIALAVSSAGGGSRMTETGMSLGTPHYMSPEQAMGEREISARSDVYALGCVTYEMLIGEPPFTGPTAQAIVAKVMTEKPGSLIARRDRIPPAVDDAVLTALEKVPADRFATAAEFSSALNGTTVTTRTASRMVPMPGGSKLRLPLLAAGILILALLLGAVLLSRRAVPSVPLRASLMAPAGCQFGDVGSNNLIQVSPDGSRVAFIATCGSEPTLWVRSLVSGESRQLQGSGNASYPFWAPSSQSLGFFAETKLKRVDLQTGAVQDLATVVGGRGGSWSKKDVILYAPDIAGPLYQVPATGGIPAVVTAVAPDSQKIVTCRIPMFLPDGERFLYSRGLAAGTASTGSLWLGRLGSPDDKQVLPFASNVAYTDGRLLFGRNGLLLAQEFDPANGKLSGQPVSVVPGLESWAFRFLENFSVSEDGRILVYRAEPSPQNRVEWFDPRSGASSTILEAGRFPSVRVSPDGKRLLLERSPPDDSQVDAWVYDITNKGWGRLTSAPSLNYDFAWSPDGQRIAYDNSESSLAYLTALDRSTIDTVVDTLVTNAALAVDWSPDGSYLVGWRQVRTTGFDIVLKPLQPSGSLRLLYSTPADETSPRLSRDGRFLAYASNQTGRYELFVTRMPAAAAHWQVSQDGISIPRGFRVAEAWGPGGLLYFANSSQQLMVAVIRDAGGIGKPTPVHGAPPNIVGIDVAADGRLVLLRSEASDPVPLSLIEHWTGMLESAH